VRIAWVVIRARMCVHAVTALHATSSRRVGVFFAFPWSAVLKRVNVNRHSGHLHRDDTHSLCDFRLVPVLPEIIISHTVSSFYVHLRDQVEYPESHLFVLARKPIEDHIAQVEWQPVGEISLGLDYRRCHF